MKALGVFLIHLAALVAVIFVWFTLAGEAHAQEVTTPAYDCQPPQIFTANGFTVDASDRRIRWCVPWYTAPDDGSPGALAPRSDEPGGVLRRCSLSVVDGFVLWYSDLEPGDLVESDEFPDLFGPVDYSVSCRDDGGYPLRATATFPDAPPPPVHPLGFPGVPVRRVPSVEDGGLFRQPGDEGLVPVNDN